MLLLLLLAGCKSTLFTPAIELADLRLDVARQANDNAAFAVELVMVDDAELLQKILALDPAQWFETGAKLRRDYPQDMQGWYYELVPGQQYHIAPTPFDGKRARALLLFANYGGRAAYRLRLEQLAKARVLFQENGIELAKTP